ncbi:MAG: hypothetical protein EOM20_13485 [Spartobacteria bacterium]|nr:hypothetical protein [Spartobacteria bacterium]
MKHLIVYLLMGTAAFAQGVSNAGPALRLFDFRSDPPQPAKLHFGQKFVMTATCINEGTNAYCVFWEPLWEGKQVHKPFCSGGTWCPPGETRVSYYAGHDTTVRVDAIHYFAYGRDDKGEITYTPRYELDSIDVEYSFTEPRPEIESNPLLADVNRIGMHPDIPGFRDIENALLDMGLKHPSYSACPTTEAVILVGPGVPVGAAQVVIRICVDHMQIPLRDIQLDYLSRQDRGYRDIYIGLRSKPRYDQYPAEKLTAILEPGISLDEFHERLEQSLPED